MEKGKKVVVMLTKVFFSEHPKSGQETHFADLVKAGKKIHTCRDNFNYWAEKIASLKRTGGVLSVRQWSGKPYRSPQEIVVEIPASKVGVRRERRECQGHHRPLGGRRESQER